MPYKYIGRTTHFKGKSLWEIVGNLKNFGIGRIVTRSRFERYPEPSYMKILKVEPLECPEKQTMDNLRLVRVTVERTFRGKKLEEPICIQSTSYKTDYRLIPKHEEDSYCHKLRPISREIPVFPKYTHFPPLLKELLMREMKTTEEPKLEVVYNPNNYGKYRIAEDGEDATVEFNISPEKTPNASTSTLYQNLKQI